MQQCMKLSLTNSPIGLIVLIDHAHRHERIANRMERIETHIQNALQNQRRVQNQRKQRPQRISYSLLATPYSLKKIQLLTNIALSRPGGHGGAAAPVPIPNTAVKRPSANGTSS